MGSGGPGGSSPPRGVWGDGSPPKGGLGGWVPPGSGGSGGSSPRASTAVLFDMDGLMIDSEPLWLEAETAIMARLGAEWTEKDQAALLGGSLERSVCHLLAKATRPAPPELVGEWLMSDIIERVRRDGVPVRPGARELLASVRRAGLPHALVTSF